MKIIYADEIFVLNMLINYILLEAAGRFCGLPFKRIRLIMAGGIGGMYAVTARVLPGTVISWTVTKMAFGAMLPLCAFGYVTRSAFVRRLSVFWILSALLGGAVLASAELLGSGADSTGVFAELYPGGFIVVSFALGLMLLTSAEFSGAGIHAREERVKIKVEYGGRSVEFTALVDSGNTLRDPVSGAPVVVAEREAIYPLFDAVLLGAARRHCDDALAFISDIAGSVHARRFRVVPCSTATGHTVMPVMRPDSVYIGGEKVDALIGISNVPIGEGNTFSALAGRIKH